MGMHWDTLVLSDTDFDIRKRSWTLPFKRNRTDVPRYFNWPTELRKSVNCNWLFGWTLKELFKTNWVPRRMEWKSCAETHLNAAIISLNGGPSWFPLPALRFCTSECNSLFKHSNKQCVRWLARKPSCNVLKHSKTLIGHGNQGRNSFLLSSSAAIEDEWR